MDSSPFGKLSAELRNEIYGLALSVAEPILITLVSDDRLESSVKQPTALLQTCRQIRAEATKMFYANNAFRLADSTPVDDTEVSYGYAVLFRFLRSIGRHNSNTIKHASVDIRYDMVRPGIVNDSPQDHIKSQIANLRRIAGYRNFESFKLILELNYDGGEGWEQAMVELDILDYLRSRTNTMAQCKEQRRQQNLALQPSDHNLDFTIFFLRLLE